MRCNADALRTGWAGVQARWDQWEDNSSLASEAMTSDGKASPELSQRWQLFERTQLNTSHYLLLPDRFGNGTRTGRLGEVLTHLSGGTRPIQLGIAGASVSVGSGLDDKLSAWPYVVARAIQQIWPRAQLTVHNGARAATVAAFAALCYDSLFRTRLDLLLIEYSWNTDEEAQMAALVAAALERGTAVMAIDYQHGVLTQGWKQCGMDPLCSTRHCAAGKRCVPRVDCPRPGWTVSGGHCFIGKVFAAPRRVKHWKVFAPDAAPFYGSYVPVVSNVAMVRDARNPPALSHLGLRKIDGTMSEAGMEYARRFFVSDGSHPSARGHLLISRLVIHALFRAHERLASAGCPPRDDWLRGRRAAAVSEGVADGAGGTLTTRTGVSPSATCSLGDSLRSLQLGHAPVSASRPLHPHSPTFAIRRCQVKSNQVKSSQVKGGSN